MWEADLICCVYSCCCVRELSTLISFSCIWVHNLGECLHIYTSSYEACLSDCFILGGGGSEGGRGWSPTVFILHVICCLSPAVRFSQISCFYIGVKVVQTAGVAGCLLCLSRSLCQFMNFGLFLRLTCRGEVNACMLSQLRDFAPGQLLFISSNNTNKKQTNQETTFQYWHQLICN